MSNIDSPRSFTTGLRKLLTSSLTIGMPGSPRRGDSGLDSLDSPHSVVGSIVLASGSGSGEDVLLEPSPRSSDMVGRSVLSTVDCALPEPTKRAVMLQFQPEVVKSLHSLDGRSTPPVATAKSASPAAEALLLDEPKSITQSIVFSSETPSSQSATAPSAARKGSGESSSRSSSDVAPVLRPAMTNSIPTLALDRIETAAAEVPKAKPHAAASQSPQATPADRAGSPAARLADQQPAGPNRKPSYLGGLKGASEDHSSPLSAASPLHGVRMEYPVRKLSRGGGFMSNSGDHSSPLTAAGSLRRTESTGWESSRVRDLSVDTRSASFQRKVLMSRASNSSAFSSSRSLIHGSVPSIASFEDLMTEIASEFPAFSTVKKTSGVTRTCTLCGLVYFEDLPDEVMSHEKCHAMLYANQQQRDNGMLGCLMGRSRKIVRQETATWFGSSTSVMEV